ncbi:unnamed protein product [Mesocestoides corti]|uniref:BPTI/Kunitz inhibitor domain-containing protein n=1 Tax=Mesocestoides corti TaxID=53468 RepID=A0A0R3UMW4_MESCO|nr:unnamed protein product [Mesocestoides corti]
MLKSQQFQNQICELPIVQGRGRALMPMWAYDAANKRCILFHYGGSGGNANRFDTKAACKKACEPNRRRARAS